MAVGCPPLSHRFAAPQPEPHEVATATRNAEGNPVPVSPTLYRHGGPPRYACRGVCRPSASRYREQRKKDDGWVVAPSRMPTKASARIKTDRREARPRARLARAEPLSARKAATVHRTACGRSPAARHRPGARGPDPSPVARRGAWSNPGSPHRLASRRPRPGHAHPARRQRLAQARPEHGQVWRVPPVVEARHAWRGGPGPGAVILGAALGALTRRAPAPSSTATGQTTAQHPGQPWAGPSEAWHTVRRLAVSSCNRRATPYLVLTRPSAGACASPGVQAQAVPTPQGHCPLNATGFLQASAETQPRCGGTLDGVQRLGQDTRASSEAGTRRRQGRWSPPHGDQQAHPASLPGSDSWDARRAKTIMKT